MTLDEAIKYCEEKAKELAVRAELLNGTATSNYGTWTESIKEQSVKDCIDYAVKHKQLADWLKELKEFREKNNT